MECSICCATTGVLFAANGLPEAVRHQLLQHAQGANTVCKVCVERYVPGAFNTGNALSGNRWPTEEEALWQAGNADGRFQHKGEHHKGCGVHRFQCAGPCAPGDNGRARWCQTWCYVRQAGCGAWVMEPRGVHTCTSPAPALAHPRLDPIVCNAIIDMARRQKAAKPNKHISSRLLKRDVQAKIDVSLSETPLSAIRKVVERAGPASQVVIPISRLRQMVREHSDLPEDRHQAFVISTPEDILGDGAAANMVLSTKAMLGNIQSCVQHAGVLVTQVDTARYVLPQGWNVGLLITQDMDHQSLPIGILLSSHEDTNSYATLGTAVKPWLPTDPFPCLGDLAAAIDAGWRKAEVKIECVACYMHTYNIWESTLKAWVLKGKLTAQLYEVLEPCLFLLHLVWDDKQWDNAWASFLRDYGADCPEAAFVQWWDQHHVSDRAPFHCGALPPGFQARDKGVETMVRDFRRFVDDCQIIQERAFHAKRRRSPVPDIDDLLLYLLTDGLQHWSHHRTTFTTVDASCPIINSGDGKKRSEEDIFHAGRDLFEAKTYMQHKQQLYCWRKPQQTKLTQADVTSWLALSAKANRTWAETQFVFSILSFTAHTCNCRKSNEWHQCRHRVASAIHFGAALPEHWVSASTQRMRAHRKRKAAMEKLRKAVLATEAEALPGAQPASNPGDPDSVPLSVPEAAGSVQPSVVGRPMVGLDQGVPDRKRKVAAEKLRQAATAAQAKALPVAQSASNPGNPDSLPLPVPEAAGSVQPLEVERPVVG